MPSMKKFMFDDTRVIDNEWLKEMASKGQKIALIKALRTVSNLGLKEAKDAIEQHCMDGYVYAGIASIGTLNPDKLIGFFSQFIGPFPTKEEVESLEKERADAEAAKKDETETKALLKGLECICLNWQTLGFFNKFQACSLIIENFGGEKAIPRAS